MRYLGWGVLALVFVDEVVAMVALGYWGWHRDPGWLWAWVLPLVAMLAWLRFAAPKARYAGPVLRPLVKVLVFGLATLALWSLGHRTAATGFLVFSITVNALAQIPAISALVDEPGARRR